MRHRHASHDFAPIGAVWGKPPYACGIPRTQSVPVVSTTICTQRACTHVVLWDNALHRFYFYSHEPNEPPHIHIARDNLSAKFWLKPVALAKNIRFRGKELRKLESLVRENQEKLVEAWNEYFGN